MLQIYRSSSPKYNYYEVADLINRLLNVVLHEETSKLSINAKSVGCPSCDSTGRCYLGMGSGPYWVRCFSDSTHASSGYLAQVP